MLTDKWITKDTLVRALDGWVPAEEALNRKSLVGFDAQECLYKEACIIEYNKFYYRGNIKSKGKPNNAFTYYSMIDDIKGQEEEIYYEGYMYNIVTDSNNIVIANPKLSKYIIATCHKRTSVK